jgi:hypothetical protein
MGNYRIYANRADDLAWSVDSGTQEDEVQVADIRFYNCSGYTMTDFSVRTGDDKTPKWWIVVHKVTLEISLDIANFYGEAGSICQL